MFKIFSVSNPSLDYETFAKRNSLKFTLGRLRTAITNTRQEIRFSCNSDSFPEMSIGTSPDFVQSLEFFLARLKSGFCLDQIKTRFESGLGLYKIQISVSKLKNLKIRKIEIF